MGSIMDQFTVKLRKLQSALSPLRRKYDSVMQKVNALRDKLEAVQDLKASNPDDQ